MSRAARMPLGCAGGVKPRKRFIPPKTRAAPSMMKAEDWTPMSARTTREEIRI